MIVTPKDIPAEGSRLRLSENALRVLEKRYLKRDEEGNLLETPEELFRRVARAVAGAELRYGELPAEALSRIEGSFYRLMSECRFLPNSPTLMNAGRKLGMLSACFVLPVGDSIQEIFDSVKAAALIQKAGGGTGFAFDQLRPSGDFISSSGGTTSGPISFWKVFSEATNAIQQGAFRRGANMGMMSVTHPDILKFMHAKEDLTRFTNFNISVKLPDRFMEQLKANPNAPHVVVNPRTRQRFYLPKSLDVHRYQIQDLVPAEGGAIPEEKFWTVGQIFDAIVYGAWRTGEPGVVFIDRVNEANPTPHLGNIEATNPCGEQPLLPFEACNLGSINLAAFIKQDPRGKASYDWSALRETVQLAVRYLDDVIDVSTYPLVEIQRMSQGNRKIGLGVMGFADALFKLGLPYNSEGGVKFGEEAMRFVNEEAHAASEKLAQERGTFPFWEGSVWHRQGRKMRNAAITTVAPTGTISIIAGCSGGIEPMFSLAFIRKVLEGQELLEVNPHFLEALRKAGLGDDEAIFHEAIRKGSVQHLDRLPAEIRRVFVCAHDIQPEWHIKMQAAFQRHCDASISKTINFPHQATPEEVRQIYLAAHESGCKGVTVYRDGCRENQPMSLQEQKAPKLPQTAEGKAEDLPCIKPISTPSILPAVRVREMTPFGHVHLSITMDPKSGRELEVFAQLGKGGDVAASDLEAICRMVSLFLRSGGSLDLVIDQLEGIGSSLSVPSKEGRIMSLADGVARALARYASAKAEHGLRAIFLGEVDVNGRAAPQNKENNDRKPAKAARPNRPPSGVLELKAFKVKCPECHGQLRYEEGCIKCHSCGFSQC